MACFLDTNIAIGLRDREVETLNRMAELTGPLMLSVVTQIELESGVYRDPARSAISRQRLDIMLQALFVIPFDDRAVAAYRGIVEVTGYSRRKLLDRMIAAQAIAQNAALVTRNGSDFRDCPGLNLIEW